MSPSDAVLDTCIARRLRTGSTTTSTTRTILVTTHQVEEIQHVPPSHVPHQGRLVIDCRLEDFENATSRDGEARADAAGERSSRCTAPGLRPPVFVRPTRRDKISGSARTHPQHCRPVRAMMADARSRGRNAANETSESFARPPRPGPCGRSRSGPDASCGETARSSSRRWSPAPSCCVALIAARAQSGHEMLSSLSADGKLQCVAFSGIALS